MRTRRWRNLVNIKIREAVFNDYESLGMMTRNRRMELEI